VISSINSRNYIILEVPMLRNQSDYRPQHPIFRRYRKQIKTPSRNVDQFLILHNYAKSFDRFRTKNKR